MFRTQFIPALFLNLIFVVMTGLLFPIFVWALAQIGFSHQAHGSLIAINGKIVGSELIGQSFSEPKYFHGRPSAAGSGYDPLSSGGTNLGPTSQKLFQGLQDDPATKEADESFAGIKQLAAAYREENGLKADAILPADAVTRSGSGLDPHISIQNAYLQIARVSKARAVSVSAVKDLIDQNREGRFLAIFGEPRVNVLKLNVALDQDLVSKH